MPLHPIVVHFPLAMTFLLPVMVLIFALAMRSGKMSKEMWFVIIGLQVLITATGYLALETGETDEDKVALVTGKEIIHAHENSAEIFVGMTVVSLAGGIVAWFLRPEFQERARLGVFLLTLLPVFFGWKTGHLGGEIVYKHGGSRAHADMKDVFRPQAGHLAPVDQDNESLKLDENDYSGESVIEEENKSED
ncbi:MAG: DUF2231 domain-containing protein [Bacteriovoracaceae bacterium]